MVPFPYDVLVTVLALVLFLVGMAGIVLPVLPGTITLTIAMLVWAILIGGWPAWVGFGLVLVLSIIGMTSSYVLTGRRLKSREVPNWAILVAVAGAIIGAFAIPVVGIPVGFIIGLYLAEAIRLKDWKTAFGSTGVALKAIGIGILIELGCALLSLCVFIAAAITHFVIA